MPEDIMTLLETAYRLHQDGRTELAEKKYLEVLKKDRNNIHALNMLGMLSFWQKVIKGFILVLAILLNEKLRK